MREVTSVCRICIGTCGTILAIDDEDRIVGIRGNKAHPLSRGYACTKGLNVHAAARGRSRILRPLKRQPDGTHREISLAIALDEIAAKLKELMDTDGPNSIALFKGTQAYLNVALSPMLEDWMRAIGSHQFFTTMTIDQSAKFVAMQRLGMFAAPQHHFHDADVLLLAGTNPLVSLSVMGVIAFNMTKQFKDAKARGMKLIVVDPRRSETAQLADVHLQVRPGEDPTLFAGIIREILVNEWHDADFCRRHVAGLDDLRAAVDPYTLDYVEQRADVPGHLVAAAARLFAHESRKGCANSGTGPNMAARSNLAEHLIQCLNAICGRYLRAGDRLRNPGVLNPQDPPRAEAIPPMRGWETGPKSRVRGIGAMFGEMMSGTLPEEILTPGPGRIRALIVDGGNPAIAMPDQLKTVEALRALDLLVSVEPFMTETASLAHYVLPPPLLYEREDLLHGPGYEPIFMPGPFQQFVPAAVPHPAGSELIEEWRIYWELARRLGCQITYAGSPLDMRTPPTTRDLLQRLMARSPITVDELATHAMGVQLDLPAVVVENGRNDPALRMQVMPPDVAQELAEVWSEPQGRPESRFPFRLTSRRTRESQNSYGLKWDSARARLPYNPAFMHPDDMQMLGIAAGDRIEIESDTATIAGMAKPDETLRRGQISMSHCWGGLPDAEGDYQEVGSCTARLVSLDRDCEPINHMPRMSAIPVAVRRAASPAASGIGVAG